MKTGYKHKTGIFGDGAEHYVSQLFLLHKHPENCRRPDLISANGRYRPRLSLEVKSGAKKKGVMVESQLAYAVTTEEDYRDLLGEEIPDRSDFLEGVDWKNVAPFLPISSVAYYYDVVDRIGGTKSADLDRPFSPIKFVYGDQYIVPHQFGFFAFAVIKQMRTGFKIEEVISELKHGIKSVVIDRHSHYENRNKGSQAWQNIHGRDILACFHDDTSYATKQGVDRVNGIRRLYPQMDDLKRIKIEGPNETTIYVMAEPEHEELFDQSLRNTVKERKPVIEKITRGRKRALSLLEKMVKTESSSLFPDFEMAARYAPSSDLTLTQIKKLNRLMHWLDLNEEPLKLKKPPIIDDPPKYEDPIIEEVDEEYVPF